MKTWRSFAILLLFFSAAIAASIDLAAPEDWFSKALLLSVALYGGCLPWLLTRSVAWAGLRATSGKEALSYRPEIVTLFRKTLAAALIYGGLVFWCSTDHNSMGESCTVIYPYNREEVGSPNWFFNGEPCRLTPMAFFDFAVGTGIAMLLLQIPLVLYWLGYHLLWLSRRIRAA